MLQELSNLQAGLLEKNRLYLCGMVDEKMVSYAKRALILLTEKECPDITIEINIPGGYLEQAMRLFYLFRDYPGHITGIVSSVAKSAGVIVLQSCDTRVAKPHSRLMIHHPETANRINYDVLIDPEKLNSLFTQLEDAKQQLYWALSRLGKSNEELAAQCRLAAEMSADEALAFGLIDTITAD